MVYRDLVPIVTELRANGASMQGVADGLNEMGHLTQRPWQRGTVHTLLRREGLSVEPPAAWIGESATRCAQVEKTMKRYAEVIAEVKRRREIGATMAQIACHLNENGARTLRGLLLEGGRTEQSFAETRRRR
jgi:hypothetical protein